ncbi:uncharacterized protein YdaU (DUF1376 family) [Bradyrhizobium sp. CIR48]|uniref:YdaU family protein n=1 Tax=Bradyrhizobium sp. CIR48 TaxID=2663840 RepID=UPI001606665C|nr:DUF1376 domain-containing protein [Bradyrhizobium sp. CIR48]MBB4424388.1 uncharacterized protein YdaU (DUF1376 family) [Bradyrhizobium sp. CIR48]
MPLYIADYLAGTAHLTTVEHGAYLLLLMHYWIKGEPPASDDIARRVTRMTNRQWAKSSGVLKSLFCEGWRHDVLDLELAKVIEKSTIASANARKGHADRKPTTASSQETNTHHTQNHIDSDVGKGRDAPTMKSDRGSPDVERLVDAFLSAAGFPDRSRAPPTWYNLVDRAALWVKSAYPANMIVQETRLIAEKSPSPKPLSYYEKVFATAFARLQQPLPTVPTPRAESTYVRRRSSQRQSIREVLDARIAAAEQQDQSVRCDEVCEATSRLVQPSGD